MGRITMKRALYLLSGGLSGFFIVLIMLIILAQIIGRMAGFIVPSAEDFSGYALAASTFFGLAYTFHEAATFALTSPYSVCRKHGNARWKPSC